MKTLSALSKKSFFIIVLLLMSIPSLAQFSDSEIRVYYGFSDSDFLRNDDLDGATGTEMENFNEIGIRYVQEVSEKISLESGINYLKSDVVISPHFIGEPVSERKENVEIISVPIYVNYSIGRYLFINGGPMVDFQLTDNSTDSQNGIGYSLGIGGKYQFNKFLIYVNPNFKRHSLIPFDKEDYHQKLTEVGLQMGIGYRF